MAALHPFFKKMIPHVRCLKCKKDMKECRCG